MNMFILIQNIRKLKAALTAIVLSKDNDDKEKLIKKAEDLYMKSSTLYKNKDDYNYNKPKDKFSNFIDNDMREKNRVVIQDQLDLIETIKVLIV